jgi:hypothetical protein
MVDDVIRKEIEALAADLLKVTRRLDRLVLLAAGETAAASIMERLDELYEPQGKPKQKPFKVRTLDDLLESQEPALKEKPKKRTLHDRILEVFYREAHGGETLTRHQVYYYSGCSPTSSGVNTAYADLFDDELLQKVKGGAQLTPQGLSYCFEAGFIAEPFDIYATFEAFVSRQNTNLQKILRAHRKDGHREYERRHLCALAGVSVASSGTNTAIARLVHLDVATTGRGIVTFSDWYMKAIQPVVRAFDTKSGVTTRHDVETGKPR